VHFRIVLLQSLHLGRSRSDARSTRAAAHAAWRVWSPGPAAGAADIAPFTTAFERTAATWRITQWRHRAAAHVAWPARARRS
jgi:hypothetical protein